MFKKGKTPTLTNRSIVIDKALLASSNVIAKTSDKKTNILKNIVVFILLDAMSEWFQCFE